MKIENLICGLCQKPFEHYSDISPKAHCTKDFFIMRFNFNIIDYYQIIFDSPNYTLAKQYGNFTITSILSQNVTLYELNKQTILKTPFAPIVISNSIASPHPNIFSNIIKLNSLKSFL